MTVKFTPGEWEAIPPRAKGRHWKVGARGALGGTGPIARVAGIWCVAEVHNGAPGDTLGTEAANARLIAAAKDLLAACQMVLDDPGLTASANDVIRAAIRKATGE